jgi:hypothetical protein
MIRGGFAMPLRDHFRPPLDQKRSWDELHGAWPTVIVMSLNKRLPPRYVAGPRIHLGTLFEIDVASYEEEEAAPLTSSAGVEDGGVATAVWAPPQPTLAVATDLPDQDEYEVRLFIAKCAALLREQVSVSIIDVVTTRQFNLYGDLVEWVGHNGPSTTPEPLSIYAAACRWRRVGDIARLETWAHPLEVGQPLPTLPLWLADDLSVPLELEASYEETCRILRIA